FIPEGGPSGGDGGRGGNIIFEAKTNLNTLIDFRYTQHFKDKKGGNGLGKECNGKGADDMIIAVPVGTEVIDDETGDVLADLLREGQRFVAAEGGRGGMGNMNFKSSTNRAPRKATPGEPGVEKWLRLRLKLIADV